MSNSDRFSPRQVVLIAMLSSLPVLLPAQTAVPQRGVVIEQVWRISEAAKAGLKIGDIILTWSRSESKGNIESPFDFDSIEIEQKPRGTVVLEGLRDGEKRTWIMGPDLWSVATRPVLSGSFLQEYSHCQERVKAGAVYQAAAQLRLVARTVQISDPAWLAPWLLSRAAEWWTKERHWKEVDETYEEAVRAASNALPGVRAQLLRDWGLLFLGRNDFVRVGDLLKRSLAELRTEPQDSLTVAATLHYLAGSAMFHGDLAEGEEYHRRALALREALAPNSLDVAQSLSLLGGLAMQVGDFAKAEEFYLKAIPIYDKLVPGSITASRILISEGLVAGQRGDFAKAEDYYLQGLAIQRQMAPGRRDNADTLLNLGALASQQGDLAKAEHYYLQGLEILEKLAPGSFDVASGFSGLGDVARIRGDLAKAEEYYHQALAIREKLAPGSLDSAMSLFNLGDVAKDLGDLAKAEEYYLQALAIQKKLAPGGLDDAASLKSLGELAKLKGNFLKAQDYFGQALTIVRKLAPGGIQEAEDLYAIASTLVRTAQLDQAISFFEQAVSAVESQTNRLGSTDEVRSSFRARYAPYYRDYLGALVTQNQPEQAFRVLERSRARSLLNLLAERDLVFAADLPPQVQRERKLNAAAFDRTQTEISQLNPAKDEAKIQQLLSALRELVAERERIALRVKRASPRYAALQYPQPLGVPETRDTLDQGTLLLSYSVGVERTVLFAVLPRGTEPGLSVYTLPIGEKALRMQVEVFLRLIREHSLTSRPALDQNARALYDLLVKPVEAQLAQSERVLISPDGPLHTLPFGALVRDPNQYLIEWKPFHTVISASLYAQLTQTRDSQLNPPLQFVAFGNPLYPKQDRKSANRPVNSELRSAVERGLALAPLPFSREEVTGIAALYPKRSETYLGSEATEERAKSVTTRARYVHFATHGYLDERFPLNSALVLTIPEKAEGRDNGLLQAWEIFEQVRLKADLVVLSACQTGLGKELGGEGLIGLTRAFQYAGARSILASLWNVDDLKTAQMMKSFYTQLQNGKSKDEALRTVQLGLLRSRSSSHPFYWAAFTLVGDWR